MIQEKIRKDFNKFSKEKNELAVSVLRMLFSVLYDKEKKKRYSFSDKNLSEAELESAARLSDDEVLKVVISESKKRKESIEAFRKVGREERAKREEEELKILEEYLPEQISPDELVKIVERVVEETGAKDFRDTGKVISRIMVMVKGQADGSEISRLVKEKLS